jgi:hypothetical protein
MDQGELNAQVNNKLIQLSSDITTNTSKLSSHETRIARLEGIPDSTDKVTQLTSVIDSSISKLLDYGSRIANLEKAPNLIDRVVKLEVELANLKAALNK